MLPTTDLIYFYIILSGFMTVWTFRRTIGKKEKLGEFEYIGFSAFWGIVIWASILGLNSIRPYYDMQRFFNNPLAVGLCLSLVGMFLAWVTGLFYNVSGRNKRG